MPDSSQLFALLQNKPLRAATILFVLLQVKVFFLFFFFFFSSPFFFNFIYVIFLTQYLQRLTTKSFQIFSLSQTSLNSISIKIQTQITISKLIKVGRGIKKKKKFKANLTNLSRNKEEDNRWWGRGQACVNIRQQSLCV